MTRQELRLWIRELCEDRNGLMLATILNIVAEEVEIEIEDAAGTTKPQEQIIMSVRDAGEDLARIFECGHAETRED